MSTLALLAPIHIYFMLHSTFHEHMWQQMIYISDSQDKSIL